MCKQADISIVTVCFNAEKTIAKTINSILNQKNHSYEYIIKDGGSTDGTNEIIKQFLPLFEGKKINVVYLSEYDRGIYDAMNFAVNKSAGKYICFMNADDQFADSDVFNRVILSDGFRNQEDILYGDAIMKDGREENLFCADMKLIQKRMPFVHQSCFFKNEIIRKYMYDTNYKICADYDLILKIYRDKYSFYNLHTVVAVYSLDGLSSNSFVPKMTEHCSILIRNGFLRRCSLRYFLMMGEAHIKTFLSKKCSAVVLLRLRRIYKRFIKKYK